VPSVMTGITICCGETHPVGGKQPRLIANHCINIKPSQKLGMDKPNKATSIIPTSDHEYCLTADIIPAIKPRKTLKIILYTESSRVTQNFGHNSFSIGKLVFHELPNSNFTAFFIKRPY